MLTDTVTLADLDPTVQEAFRRATIELDPEQLDKAFECWSETTCRSATATSRSASRRPTARTSGARSRKMEVILQALTYPNIGKIIYTDAQR